MLAVAEQIC